MLLYITYGYNYDKDDVLMSHFAEHCSTEITSLVSTSLVASVIQFFMRLIPNSVLKQPNYSGTSPYGHLTSKVTSQLWSPLISPKLYYTVQITPCNVVTSPLRSLLPSPVGDLNSEVPLYLNIQYHIPFDMYK